MKQPVFDKAQIPRSSAHANERKKGDKSELKRL